VDRVTVFSSFSGPEAQLLCARLRTAGLQATVEGEAAAFSMEGYSLATGGIRVQVPENEYDDARALIKSVESDEP
jgi:hypothetical protein